MLFCTWTATAQNENTTVSLYTDRDIYASGETVLCKLFLPSDEVSGIVHVALFNMGGVRISTIHLLVGGSQADGYISLPDSLSSGSYLLRASVRKAGMFTCKEIYISNRFASATTPGSRLHTALTTQPSGILMPSLRMEGLKNQYNSREEGHVRILFPEDLISQMEGNICISIADRSLEYRAPTFQLKVNSTEEHLVEKGGMILEGFVTDIATNMPCGNATIFLTIPDSIPYFKFYKTGADGRFYFQLERFYGKKLVVVQCSNQDDNRSLKISLNDPEGENIELPPFEYRDIPPAIKNGIEKNRDAVTFRKLFGQPEIDIQQIPFPNTVQYPFYGLPTETVDPKLFIDLPNFSEISRELLSGVRFRNFGRIPSIQVINLPVHTYFNENALVLLDGVPIHDLNLIANLGTKEIDKIEFGLSERFFGTICFKGFLAIHTSKIDYSRIPASDDLVKLSMDGIQSKPMLAELSYQSANDPDFRQLLVWKPSVTPAQEIGLDFRTSDIQGDFRIIVRGKRKDGSIVFSEQQFEVK